MFYPICGHRRGFCTRPASSALNEVKVKCPKNASVEGCTFLSYVHPATQEVYPVFIEQVSNGAVRATKPALEFI